MSLPEWLSQPPAAPAAARAGHRSWIASAAKRLLSIAVPSDHRNTRMSMDARAAVLGFVALIVCATVLRSPAALAACWIASLALSLAAGASPRTLAASSLAAALLTALLMLPAATASVTPGEPLAAAGGIVVTAPGLRLMAVVVLRTLACLTFGIGLFASNRPEDLFAALRWLRVPAVFVMVLLMTHRYLLVLARSALEVHVARRSRIADEPNLAGARRWLGEQIGALYARSRALGEQVHLAMVARGFHGDWAVPPRVGFRLRDAGYAVLCMSIAGLLIFLDRSALH